MAKEIDPVCEMEINAGDALGLSDYVEQIYYFCSAGCKSEFEANPEKYVHRSENSRTFDQ